MFVFCCVVSNNLYCRACLFILWGQIFVDFVSFLSILFKVLYLQCMFFRYKNINLFPRVYFISSFYFLVLAVCTEFNNSPYLFEGEIFFTFCVLGPPSLHNLTLSVWIIMYVYVCTCMQGN